MFINPTKETIELTKQALGQGQRSLRKGVSISTGLTWYDLQAPAKNLYPVVTPLRNSIPRVGRANPGDAARWKQVTALTGSGFDSMGWVPEGQRSATMSYTASSMSAAYVTLGEEDYLTFEAEAAAQGLEDEDAMVSLRLLQKMMRKEEIALLGGNASISLGTPTAPTLSASGSGGTLSSATYSVIVVALTLEGWKNASLSGGVATTKTITGADGKTFTLNGGSSNKSSNTTQAVTLGQTLFATTPAIQGAVAYAWFVGTAGSETLQAITTINSATFNAPLTGSRQAISTVTSDCSANANYAFDGLLTQTLNPNNLGYVNTLASRRLQLWSSVPSSEKPALFLAERSDTYARSSEALPEAVTMEVDIYLYTDGGKDQSIVPASILNPLIDAIDTALAPSPLTGLQTLGGLVSHCWIEGKIMKDPGDLDGDGVAVIPVKILVPR